MKILVAGPLPKGKTSGGVAVFTENIAKEAALQKHTVMIATRGRKSNYDHIDHVVVENIFNIEKILKFHPDLVISSLQYSFILSFYNLKCKKVHILHGFTNFSYYTSFRFFLMHYIDRIVRKRFEYFIANSEYTQYINKVIFNIKSDGIMYIGISNKQLNYLEKNLSKSYGERTNLLYVGRLVPAKNVEVAIKAFNLLKDNNKQFEILGYGSEYNRLYSKFHSDRVKFGGSVSYKNIIKQYLTSKVFISLNDSEPFGITYVEALASGMFVVAPNKGGQVEFLKHFPGRYKLVDVSDEDDICKAIQIGFHSKLKPLTKKQLDKLSYKETFDMLLNQTIKKSI